MAFAHETLVFGGRDQTTIFGDTWKLGGNYSAPTWTRVDIPGPPARFDHAMVWDSRRRVVVLFGGRQREPQTKVFKNLSDTWEYSNSQGWRQIAISGPSARGGHGMCFDRRRGRTVLYGSGTNLTDAAETWEYDGAAWTRVVAASAPGPRTDLMLAYDDRRAVTVLFGGINGDGSTWEWNGQTWLQKATTGPPVRHSGGMDYDSHRQLIVLAGGSAGQNSYFTDTWEWNGTEWTNAATSTLTLMQAHTLTYDAVRRTSVLFGGFNGGSPAPLFSNATRGYPSNAPLVLVHPANATGCAGDGLNLAVVAVGTPPLTYHWRHDGTPVGGNFSTLHLSSISQAAEGSYEVEVDNDCGSFTSNSATVTVHPRTVITEQPLSRVSAPAPCKITFTVVATGQGTLTYKWFHERDEVPNATASSIELIGDPSNVGVYVCQVTGDCGTVVSDPVTLTIGGTCCPTDYDLDGVAGTDADIQAIQDDIAAGHGSPGHANPDYNHDGQLDQADVNAFVLDVLIGVACP